MPNKLKDLSGQRFGKLTVIKRSEKNISNRPAWICNCDCGNSCVVSSNALRNGQISCGCMAGFRRIYGTKEPLFLRKHSNRLYHAWSEMKRRCNGKCTNHQYYGDKGISYCEEWEDFDVFARWSIDNGYHGGLEIDRIDGDKDYSPDNCRWVSHKKNSRNRKARSNNTTGVSGVYERKKKDGSPVYCVTIATDDGKLNLGTFCTLEEAKNVRRNAEVKYWGFNIGE